MSFSKLGAMISDAANFINDFINDLPWNRRVDPEWLLAIQGDSPLLGPSEWEYIAEVRHRIIREARPGPNIPSDRRLKEKICVMKNNLDAVVRYLKHNSECKDYFVETYPSWRSFRDTSITQLKDIAKAVEINRRESAASRKTGSSMSLAGGLMCLVPGLGALRIAGSVLMGIGSLAAFASSIVELEKFKKKIKEAENVVLQDKRYSEKLWKWMNDVSHIEEAYNVIKYMDVDLDLKRIAFDLHGLFKTKSTPEDMALFIGKAVLSLKFSPGMVTEIADFIAMSIATSMLYERYRPMFNLAFDTYKFKRMLFTIGSVIATTATMASMVNASCKGSTLSTFQKSRIGVGIILDVITIIQACEDMESTSKEAVEIVKAAEKLQKEADIFEKVYKAVRRFRSG